MSAPILLLVLLSLSGAEGKNADPECQRGCFTDNAGWTYEVRRADVEWFAKALWCEAGTKIPGPESDAVAWTLVHRFYQTREMWPTFASFLDAYSQCIGSKWSSSGHRRTKRDIVAQVDRVRSWGWAQIPASGRWLAARFLSGLVPDRHPTWVHFVACGYEEHRADGAIGPYYVGRRSSACNAYYEMRPTVPWTEDTVIVVPAPVSLPPIIEALSERWRSAVLAPLEVREVS